MFSKFKGRIIVWAIESFTDEKYRFRRALLIPQINKWLKKNWWKEEGNNMNGGKKWHQSRAVWTAIVGVVLGAIQPISSALGHPIVVPAWVYEVLGAFGLYTIRDAIGKDSQIQ